MRTDRYTQKRKENRKKWFVRILTGSLVVIALVLGMTVGYYGSRINRFLDDISADAPEEYQDTSEQDLELENLRPFSVLILGLDELDGIQRSDTIMVATVNPDLGSVKLVSIPRDTMVTMENGQLDKINAMYAYGGISQTIETVEDYLDIPISFYATLDFEGLIELVDAVGGIEVDSPLSFTVQDENESMHAIEIEEGRQRLDGQQALGYARMRKQDPRGDWGRQERQREVIQSLVSELVSMNTLTNFNSILDAVQPHLETNMRGNQMLTIASNYSHAAETMESLTLTGEEDYVYFPHYGQEVYVWLPYEETIAEIQEELRAHLELDSMGFEESELLDEDFEASDFYGEVDGE